MSPMRALWTVLRKGSDFKGRASRSEYWWWQGWVVLGSALCAAASLWRPGLRVALVTTLSLGVIVVIVASLAVLVRRLHDTGRSAWWVAIILVPAIGLLVLLFFTMRGSQDHPNAWGPPPTASSHADPAWPFTAQFEATRDRLEATRDRLLAEGVPRKTADR